MQANAILIHVCMKCYTYMYGARLKHIGASIITRIVNVQKVGGGGGGGGGGEQILSYAFLFLEH